MSHAEYEKRVAKISFGASMRKFVRKVIDGAPDGIADFDASFVA